MITKFYYRCKGKKYIGEKIFTILYITPILNILCK